MTSLRVTDVRLAPEGDTWAASVTYTVSGLASPDEAAQVAQAMRTGAVQGILSKAAAPSTEPSHPPERPVEGAAPAPDIPGPGGLWGGVKVKKRGYNRTNGFAVLDLEGGVRVKVCLKTGDELARKTVEAPPPPPQDPAPPDTKALPPIGHIPAPVLEAETLKEAIQAALDLECGGDDFVAWATSVKDVVPAFEKVSRSRFAARVTKLVEHVSEGGE